MNESANEWLAIRKEAAKEIDPETAEVMWAYGYSCDPYGIGPEPQGDERQIQRHYFACSPENDIWVCFRDLPDATCAALMEKHEKKLAFPAGLPLEWLNKKTSDERSHRPIINRKTGVIWFG